MKYRFESHQPRPGVCNRMTGRSGDRDNREKHSASDRIAPVEDSQYNDTLHEHDRQHCPDVESTGYEISD